MRSVAVRRGARRRLGRWQQALLLRLLKSSHGTQRASENERTDQSSGHDRSSSSEPDKRRSVRPRPRGRAHRATHGRPDRPVARRGRRHRRLRRCARSPLAPDRDQARATNPQVVARVALDVAERVAAANADGRLPVAVGGDCTVGVGTYVGVRRGHNEPWLLHLDPHPELIPRKTTRPVVALRAGPSSSETVIRVSRARLGSRLGRGQSTRRL
ncbi:MAG: arginase family protein [Jatrophihabitans sp.]